MNKLLVVLSLIVSAGLFTGCTTMEEKWGKKVGCTKDEVKVDRRVNAPGYQEYQVICKNVEYSCKQAPFTERCDIDDSNTVPAKK
jgi:hypothetical protein